MTSPHDQPLSRREARRALEAEHAGIASFAQPPTAGRSRSASSAQTVASAPTDITYRTQVRPRVPQYDERAVDVAPLITFSDPMPQAPPPVAPAAGPEHGIDRVRRRDFRPRVVDEPTHAVSTPDTSLDYHTQGTHPGVHSPAVTAAPATDLVIDASPAPLQHANDPAPDRTLTRRELRELYTAQQASGTAAPLVADVGETEPPAQYRAPVLAEPVIVVPELIHPAPVAPAVPTSTGSHWSTGIHDDEDPFENTYSREVGSATSLNTNALVLPEMPTGSIAGPVSGGGEIIITGTVAVSPLHSSRGTVPSLHDSPEFDELLDGGDVEVSAPNSAPVSALKAVSGHTSSHIVMTGKPSSSNTITTVLVGSTVGMAVIAIGLFVVAAANGLF